jgi:hypothetical protein
MVRIQEHGKGVRTHGRTRVSGVSDSPEVTNSGMEMISWTLDTLHLFSNNSQFPIAGYVTKLVKSLRRTGVPGLNLRLESLQKWQQGSSCKGLPHTILQRGHLGFQRNAKRQGD